MEEPFMDVAEENGKSVGVREEDAKVVGQTEADDWLWPQLKGTAGRKRRRILLSSRSRQGHSAG